jgi:hypothetical protein
MSVVEDVASAIYVRVRRDNAVLSVMTSPSSVNHKLWFQGPLANGRVIQNVPPPPPPSVNQSRSKFGAQCCHLCHVSSLYLLLRACTVALHQTSFIFLSPEVVLTTCSSRSVQGQECFVLCVKGCSPLEGQPIGMSVALGTGRTDLK